MCVLIDSFVLHLIQ